MNQSPIEISQRMHKSIRNLQFSKFKNIMKRPALILSKQQDLHSESLLQDLISHHNRSFIAQLSFLFNQKATYLSVISISSTTLLSVIPEEIPDQIFQKEEKICLIYGNSQIVIEKISRISLKQIYPSLGHDLLIISVKQSTQIKSIGYNFSPFKHRQKRAQLLRIREQIKKKEPKFILDLKTRIIISLPYLYPYLDLERNWIMEDATLEQMQTGSPVFERVGRELYLIGFYCQKCSIPAEDNHKLLIFNARVLEKIQQISEKIIGQKVSLCIFTIINIIR